MIIFFSIYSVSQGKINLAQIYHYQPPCAQHFLQFTKSFIMTRSGIKICYSSQI